MRPLLRFPEKMAVDYIGRRNWAFGFSIITVLASLILLATVGLNLGIDFRGGILVEVRGKQAQAVDLGALRDQLGGLGLGEVGLTTIDTARDIAIRVEQQPGGEKAQSEAIAKIRGVLGDAYEVRRTEVVGPTVGAELLRAGIIASVLAVAGIAIYVWVRFEWQFGVTALLATLHDVVTVFGIYALTQIEFNLTSVAAILTVAGYSINDTVVVFDRVRENLRKYKSMPLEDLFNLSVNETMSRTINTSGTTLIVVLALLLVGGEVLLGFSTALAWGILVGTFSSIFVACGLMLVLPSLRINEQKKAQAELALKERP